MLSSVHAVHGQTLPLRPAIVPVLAVFFKSLFIPRIPQNLKFLNKFLCSVSFKNVQIFFLNSIFVTETHVCRKASSATKQRAFGIQISK